MHTYSEHSTYIPVAITRVVDDRCNSLANPGTAYHPSLMFFGQGPSNRTVFILDHGELAWTTVVVGVGAWTKTCTASKGLHRFSVCTSDGDISPVWEVTVEVPRQVKPPVSFMSSDREIYRIEW
ncbi:hypothetical protein AUC61_02520 [Pseudomonas sp. S25]|uniref:Uncharacterized protein n=1 Tax=Pseudomonas maioricensis TaxID=1766623 RepID=A0ABS9ZCZ5_9PSED|nr:hypothetical protein [Pseudomonas sp. S25]MCI8208399.1 hypothetical protein [Pseudomonas sp. S25]